jgi:hypothetical protein
VDPILIIPGTRVEIKGPVATRVVATDNSGIYDVDGLPPGEYTVQPLLPDTQIGGYSWERPAKLRLEAGAVVEASFPVFWNGTIEGHIRDASSSPAARAWVEVRKADGGTAGSVSLVHADANGFYRIIQIPPGRYVVVVNPHGPSRESGPYDTQYYPASPNVQGARVLELSEGQHISGIDFVVPRLQGKTIHVTVKLPVAYSTVCIVYETIQSYDSMKCDVAAVAGDDGRTTIDIYSNSRMQISARAHLENSNEHYSPALEFETRTLPTQLDLILTAVKPVSQP